MQESKNEENEDIMIPRVVIDYLICEWCGYEWWGTREKDIYCPMCEEDHHSGYYVGPFTDEDFAKMPEDIRKRYLGW